MLKNMFGQVVNRILGLGSNKSDKRTYLLKGLVFGLCTGIIITCGGVLIFMFLVFKPDVPSVDFEQVSQEPKSILLVYDQKEKIMSGEVSQDFTLYGPDDQILDLIDGKFEATGLDETFSVWMRDSQVAFDLSISLDNIARAENVCTGDTIGTLGTSNISNDQFVASKNSDLYHPLENCSFADRIKEENRVYFSTREEAESTGRAPSSCFE